MDLTPIPTEPGVYCIYDLDDTPTYAGKTSNLRSRLRQHNVESLEEKGYIKRIEDGNRLRTRLSKMGSLWVATHPAEVSLGTE